MRLQALLKAAAASQISIAKYVGVTQSAVSQWEKGQCFPKAAQLIKLAKFFNVKIEDLIEDAA